VCEATTSIANANGRLVNVAGILLTFIFNFHTTSLYNVVAVGLCLKSH
jgi:hypothetical protein